MHTRQFHIESKRLLIIDELGANCHAQGYLHLHPDCQIIRNTDKYIVISLLNGKLVEIYLDNNYMPIDIPIIFSTTNLNSNNPNHWITINDTRFH